MPTASAIANLNVAFIFILSLNFRRRPVCSPITNCLQSVQTIRLSNEAPLKKCCANSSISTQTLKTIVVSEGMVLPLLCGDLNDVRVLELWALDDAVRARFLRRYLT